MKTQITKSILNIFLAFLKHFLYIICNYLTFQGYRVDYAAAADALTFAPEKFDEFFNQRRRWMTSTLANIIDLLSDYKNTILANDNISYIYVFYQFMMLVSTVLGPSVITMAIASAIQAVLQTDLWVAYVLAVLPVVFYIM